MKLITKNTDYAVRALVYLAGQGDVFVSSGEIAKTEDIPLAYLRRILQELCPKGYLITKEGSTGGFKLARPLSDIRLTELIEIFQGKVQLADCLFRNTVCKKRPRCNLRKRILQIEHKVVQDLQDITLASLVNTD